MAKTNWYSEIPFEGTNEDFESKTKCPYLSDMMVGSFWCLCCKYNRGVLPRKFFVRCTNPKNLE